MTDIKALVKKYNILSYPNVVGYSNVLQKKIKNGKEMDKHCIRIYVSKKVPKEQLKKEEIIPEEIEGVCTDVVEIGVIRARAVYDKRYRPAPAGVSTSRADENAAGTIGWWIVDEDGNVYMISNNHVWAKENKGLQGDPILQPGRLDGGDVEKDVIATLYDFIPIDFSANAVNYVDVAVARPVDLSQTYASIMEIGGVTGKATPNVNDTVKKVGRTTGLTQGYVFDASATLSVQYSTGTTTFSDVIVIKSDTTVGLGGDSGSPVLDASNRFVGLFFAGSDNGTVGVACKYTYIESLLSQRWGKKVRILVANSYPPFRVQTVYQVQVVYPPLPQLMAMLAIPLMILLPLRVIEKRRES